MNKARRNKRRKTRNWLRTTGGYPKSGVRMVSHDKLAYESEWMARLLGFKDRFEAYGDLDLTSTIAGTVIRMNQGMLGENKL